MAEHVDQDAADIMGILVRSPNGDSLEALKSAARAYAAIRSARDRGAIPPTARPAPREPVPSWRSPGWKVPCPRDTDRDGDCGRPLCPICGPSTSW